MPLGIFLLQAVVNPLKKEIRSGAGLQNLQHFACYFLITGSFVLVCFVYCLIRGMDLGHAFAKTKIKEKPKKANFSACSASQFFLFTLCIKGFRGV